MLYTFSQSNYLESELYTYLKTITKKDRLLFWQDGVICLSKYKNLLEAYPDTIYILENDIIARNLSTNLINIKLISLDELVDLTTTCYPQLNL